MEYDQNKVDEMVLALLYLNSSRTQYGTRAWKGMNLAVLDRLFKKGYISDPKAKTLSLDLTEAGARLSKDLFLKFFDAKE